MMDSPAQAPTIDPVLCGAIAKKGRARPRKKTRIHKSYRPNPVLLSATQLMAYLGIGRSTFYEMLNDGRLGAYGLQTVNLRAQPGKRGRRQYLKASADKLIQKLAKEAKPVSAGPADEGKGDDK